MEGKRAYSYVDTVVYVLWLRKTRGKMANTSFLTVSHSLATAPVLIAGSGSFAHQPLPKQISDSPGKRKGERSDKVTCEVTLAA